MDTQQFLSVLPFIVYFTAAALGLWAARGFIAPLTDWFLSPEQYSAKLRRRFQMVLWLALGGFFAAPFIDLLSVLETGLTMISRQTGSLQGGLTPQPYFSLLMLLLLLVLYSTVVWVGRRVLQIWKSQGRVSLQLSGLENAALLLAPASLVYRLLRGLLLNVILLPGTDLEILNALSRSGFFLLAAAGLVVVTGVIAILYLSLKSSDLKSEL